MLSGEYLFCSVLQEVGCNPRYGHVLMGLLLLFTKSKDYTADVAKMYMSAAVRLHQQQGLAWDPCAKTESFCTYLLYGSVGECVGENRVEKEQSKRDSRFSFYMILIRIYPLQIDSPDRAKANLLKFTGEWEGPLPPDC